MSRPLLLALTALLLGAPASALTPEELWSAWQAQAAGFGVTLGAEAVPGGDGSLTLRNWTRALAGGPAEPMPADSPVQEVVLRPTGDGAVQIDLGLPRSGVLAGEGGPGLDLFLDQDGLRITAREVTQGIGYEVLADALRAAPRGAAQDRFTQDIAGEVSGIRLTFPGQVGPDGTIEVGLSLDGFAYVVDIPDPLYGMGSRQTVRSQGTMALAATLTVPEGMTAAGMDDLDVFAALDQGLAVGLDLETGEGTQTSSFDGFPFSYAYESRNEPGTGSLSLDRSGIALVGEMGGGTASLGLPTMPVPSIDLSYGVVRAELRLPMGSEVGEARYAVSMEGLTLGEAAWAALDPQALLPREPASLGLDLGGRMAFDFAAMAAAEEAGLSPPAPAIESLEVRAFDLAAAGVRISATGSFTFDDASGVPMPAGAGSVRIEGLDRLLDALVAMGWLAASDVQGARFAMAAYLRPGGAPDTREATVEIRADGSVWANGVQLQ